MEMAATVQTAMMVVFVALCGAAPAATPSQHELSKAQDYLSRFYSEVGVGARNSLQRPEDSFQDRLRRMQEFFGLEASGRLDSNTLEVMSRRRCGVSDVTRYGHHDGQPKWDKTVVTYRITDYTSDLSPSVVDATIAKALSVYSDVVPLEFQHVDSGTADIMIKFKAKDHGDFSPFDGVNGVLAHAYGPGDGFGGDAHFDEDELWTLTSAGANLFLVAAHELGHALGLAHSQVQTALMFPTYQYVNTENYVLPDDDRLGIQALYGVRARPKPQPRPRRPPNRCSKDLVFDAATLIHNNLYFFRDGHFWKKTSYWEGISIKNIQSEWPRIHKVDAAYEYKWGNAVVFFEGDQYWWVRGNAVLPGYPRPLSDFGFPSSVTKLHAAVHVSVTGRTLFFVGNRYWSYNERWSRMDFGFPKLIRRGLPGVDSRVDAAFENGGYLYFTHGSRQIEYDYHQRRVIRTLWNYEWMDCYE